MLKQNVYTPPKIQDHTVAMVNNKESMKKECLCDYNRKSIYVV